MSEEKRFSEKVMESIKAKDNNRVIPVTFPKPVYNRFKAFAFEEATNCYWLAIEKLMDKYEVSSEINSLIDQHMLLVNQVAVLEKELQELKNGKSSKDEFKTFGKKVEKENI